MTGITKETFEAANEDTKLSILFDICYDIREKQKTIPAMCDKRFKILEDRKFKDTAIAGTLGFVGGFIAVLGKKFLGMG